MIGLSGRWPKAPLVAEEAVELVEIAGTCGRGAWGSRTRVCGGDRPQGKEIMRRGVARWVSAWPWSQQRGRKVRVEEGAGRGTELLIPYREHLTRNVGGNFHIYSQSTT